MTTTTTDLCDGSDLPDDILYDLLCKLPLESVFRFKCVSKRWFSFISDPIFKHVYISRLPSSRRGPFVFYAERDQQPDSQAAIWPKGLDGRRHLLSLPIKSVEGKEQSRGRGRFHNIAIDKGRFHNIAIDKGFILVGWLVRVSKPMADFTLYNGEFYICSAPTNQWFSLPPPPPHTCLTKESIGFITRVDEDANILISYKVVLLSIDPESGFIEADMLSSETGTWEHIKVQFEHPIMFVCYCWRPLVLNNTLYWVTNERFNNSLFGGRYESVIIAYDPYTSPNQFRIIALPVHNDLPADGSRKWWPFNSNRGICQGRLRYVTIADPHNRNSPSLKIWELQEDHSSWCLEHSSKIKMEEDIVDGDHVGLDPRTIVWGDILACHPFDPDVIYFDVIYLGKKRE